MSSIANVVNGQIVNNSTAAADVNKAVEAASKEAGGSLDKDAFLQLLVTQMKYQDPLEPTDNTEYVSQLATFSELEEMQNMVQTSDRQRAGSLIGQYAVMAVNDSTGNTKYHEGYVESVVYQGSKTYLQIGGTLYNFDDLDRVYDGDYVEQIKALEQAAQALAEAQKNQQQNGEAGKTETDKVETDKVETDKETES